MFEKADVLARTVLLVCLYPSLIVSCLRVYVGFGQLVRIMCLWFVSGETLSHKLELEQPCQTKSLATRASYFSRFAHPCTWIVCTVYWLRISTIVYRHYTGRIHPQTVRTMAHSNGIYSLLIGKQLEISKMNCIDESQVISNEEGQKMTWFVKNLFSTDD